MIAKLRQFIAGHKAGIILTILTLTIFLILIALFRFGVLRFGWGWTGFFSYTTTTNTPTGITTQTHPGKTLWDVFGLIIIPAVLALGIWWLNREQLRSGQKIAKDREEDRALQNYFDAMTELILDRINKNENSFDSEKISQAEEEELKNPYIGPSAYTYTGKVFENIPPAHSMARARTLAILRKLEGNRKGIVLRYLYETNLIYRDESVVFLARADLQETTLQYAILENASLKLVNLRRANLQGTQLVGTDFGGSNLRDARLNKANLINAVLYMADLRGADLRKSWLFGADLRGADLSGADLHGAKYDKDTTWPEDFDPAQAGAELSE
jgi:uncharacterized protein YjbI with pentapeptide repeats